MAEYSFRYPPSTRPAPALAPALALAGVSLVDSGVILVDSVGKTGTLAVYTIYGFSKSGGSARTI